jgi:hypothetical protein
VGFVTVPGRSGCTTGGMRRGGEGGPAVPVPVRLCQHLRCGPWWEVALSVNPELYPHYARDRAVLIWLGDVVRLKRSPELTGLVHARRDDCLMLTAIGRRGLTGWFYVDLLELVPGQEEVFEA